MKRHPALRDLSDDHHTALVLARRLRRFAATDPQALRSLAAEVVRIFEQELEPHFQIEERWLLPALDAVAPAGPLAERTREDHRRLRALVAGPWTADTPERCGALLAEHVRFEERQLFPHAERLLTVAQLEEVRVACASRPR